MAAKKKTISVPAASLSLPEIEALVAEIADYRLTYDQMGADHAAKLRNLDECLAPIKAAHELALERIAAARRHVEDAMDERIKVVEAWAQSQKPTLFAKQRSIELLRGTIGFRLSPPRVETLKGWTFSKCAEALRLLRWGRDYLKAPVLDREAILRHRERFARSPQRRLAIGVVIRQDDVFYIEPKQERTDAAQGAACGKEARV